MAVVIHTDVSTSCIHAVTLEGPFLLVGVIKSRSKWREKATGLKKEPNVTVFLPSVRALRSETHGPYLKGKRDRVSYASVVAAVSRRAIPPANEERIIGTLFRGS